MTRMRYELIKQYCALCQAFCALYCYIPTAIMRESRLLTPVGLVQRHPTRHILFVLSKNECNFVGGVWASVTKRYTGVGGSLKHKKKGVTYFMAGSRGSG